ncbi:MAG: class I SAM-dependent methyltransferase [Chloroflexota bacterium]
MSVPDYDVIARFYDLEYGDLDVDLPLYLGFAARTGSPIVEFGCGSGRLLLPLAEAGYDVTGVDSSPAMLDLARAKLAERPNLPGRVRLLEADARDLALDERFALAIWGLNSFMHLPTQADQLRALASARAHLRGGGLLLLDLFLPDPAVLAETDGRLYHEATWLEGPAGYPVHRYMSRRADLAEQRLDVTYYYEEHWPAGEVRKWAAPFSLRYLYRYEAELLLAKAGFAVEALYGDYELDELESTSPRLIFVARKES